MPGSDPGPGAKAAPGSAFLRFALVGCLGFVVDAAVLKGALGLGAGLLSGRLASYLAAATTTWYANRRFTFAMEVPPSLGEWWRFLLGNAVGGLTNYGVYAVLVRSLPFFAANPVLAVAVGSLSGLVINFALSRRFVFRRAPGGAAREGAPPA